MERCQIDVLHLQQCPPGHSTHDGTKNLKWPQGKGLDGCVSTEKINFWSRKPLKGVHEVLGSVSQDIRLSTAVLVRSLKLSNLEPG